MRKSQAPFSKKEKNMTLRVTCKHRSRSVYLMYQILSI